MQHVDAAKTCTEAALFGETSKGKSTSWHADFKMLQGTQNSIKLLFPLEGFWLLPLACTVMDCSPPPEGPLKRPKLNFAPLDDWHFAHDCCPFQVSFHSTCVSRLYKSPLTQLNSPVPSESHLKVVSPRNTHHNRSITHLRRLLVPSTLSSIQPHVLLTWRDCSMCNRENLVSVCTVLTVKNWATIRAGTSNITVAATKFHLALERDRRAEMWALQSPLSTEEIIFGFGGET